MKRFLSILFAFVIAFGCMPLSAFAVKVNKNTVYSKNDKKVCFNQNYARIGMPISVKTPGSSDEFIYKWYIDGEEIGNFGDTYTPIKSDIESMLTAKVFRADGSLYGAVNMFVSRLPVMYIETENRNSIENKETRLRAHMTLQGNDQFNDKAVLYDDELEIKGRGNSTWLANKKPYKIKLDNKTDLLGMGKNKHWVLLSNPFDSTLSRNKIIYDLAADMGLDTMSSQWIDVVFNGKPVGNYLLCEHVRIGETRVDITDWDDVSENAAKAIYKANKATMTKDERDELIDIMSSDMNWVTTGKVLFKGKTYNISDYYEIPKTNGGYLLEGFTPEDPYFISECGQTVTVNKPEGIGNGMLEEIKNYYSAFERAALSDNFCTEYDGRIVKYSELADMESLAKYALINEIFQNQDFLRRSTFMYKDVDGKLIFGPVWDLDSSSDNSSSNYSHYKWSCLTRGYIMNVIKDPEFVKAVFDAYREYRYTAIADMMKPGGDIDKAFKAIYESGLKNDELWNNSISFESALENFRLWIQRRLDWLDLQMTSVGTLYQSLNGVAMDESTAARFNDEEPTKLVIEKMPDKLTYNLNDNIDLSGLKLKAVYADNTEQIIEPEAAISYVSDCLGAQNYFYGKITDRIGTAYISLRYRSLSVDYKIARAEREDYESVAEMIDDLSDINIVDNLQYIFSAKQEYDALSDSAKKKVTNLSKLNNIMDMVDEICENSNSPIVGCYIERLSRYNQRNKIVVVVKGEPNKLRVFNGGSVTTLSVDNRNVCISLKKNGDYSLITIVTELKTDGLQIGAYFNHVLNGELYTLDSIRLYENCNRMISSCAVPKTIGSVKETADVEVDTVDRVKKIKAEYDGKSEIFDVENSRVVCPLKFETSGLKKIKLSYYADGEWKIYKTAEVFVREIAKQDKLLAVNYPEATAYDTAQIYVATDNSVSSVTLAAGSLKLNLNFTECDGFKSWKYNTAMDGDKEFALIVDYADTGRTVKIHKLEKLVINGGELIECRVKNGNINIPHSIVKIADGAFDGFNGTIYCYKDSAAHKYAVENNIDFVNYGCVLDLPPTVKMAVGEQQTVSVKPAPLTAPDYSFTLKSQNDDIVTAENNSISAAAPGYTRVNVKSIDGLLDGEIKVFVAGGYTTGDLNADGVINSADALTILKISVGSYEPNDKQKTAADINSDGIANSADALITLQISVGIKSIWDYV